MSLKALGLCPLLGLFYLGLGGCTQRSKAAHNIFGEVDAEEIDVASRLPGRVKHILVQPGQRVKAGDVLVEFEDDVLNIKKQGAQAAIVAAEKQRDLLNDAVRPEAKSQLAAAAAAAKKQMEFAKTSLDRTRALLSEGAVAQQLVDEVEMKYQTATQAYRVATSGVDMAKTGARGETKATADAVVEQAKSLLAEIEAFEKDMSLKAPVDAEVGEILDHEGELVPMGYPVVTLVRLDKPWIVVSVPEAALAKYPMGRETSVQVPAFGNTPIKVKVSRIAAMADYATQNHVQDRGNFDLKTFEVRLDVENPPAGLRPGMTAILAKEP